MLVNVLVRSRLLAQLVENRDGPNGFEADGNRLDRCGIEPALNRDSKADLAAAEVPGASPGGSAGVFTPGLNGLVEGVGREVLGGRDVWALSPLLTPPGENFEGNVPARVLLGLS